MANSLPFPEGPTDSPSFSRLADEAFEELVLEWIRAANPNGDAYRLGPGPLKQHGCDIRASLDNGTKVCCQCKGRKHTLKPKELLEAVQEFLQGPYAGDVQKFWIVTSGDFSRGLEGAIQQAASECRKHGNLEFECIWREKFWKIHLRNFPQLVKSYLGDGWSKESVDWCRGRDKENKEEERRAQKVSTFSSATTEIYDDGYMRLDFQLPDRVLRSTSALLIFKVDGLERAMITLGNDQVLEAFDETRWESNKPMFVGEHSGTLFAQIGNVRVALTREMFEKIGTFIRKVRDGWLEQTRKLDQHIEAEGYQFIDSNSVKLGWLTAGVWRMLIEFANEHDSDEGDSKWHIFDPDAINLVVHTRTRTRNIESGHHLILSTLPTLVNSMSNTAPLELIWNAPLEVGRGASARGKGGFGGVTPQRNGSEIS